MFREHLNQIKSTTSSNEIKTKIINQTQEIEKGIKDEFSTFKKNGTVF